MPTDNTKEPTTVGKTCFYQGENNTHPLFRIEPGTPAGRPRTGIRTDGLRSRPDHHRPDGRRPETDLGFALPQRNGQGAAG